jgi:hypothetical protein
MSRVVLQSQPLVQHFIALFKQPGPRKNLRLQAGDKYFCAGNQVVVHQIYLESKSKSITDLINQSSSTGDLLRKQQGSALPSQR